MQKRLRRIALVLLFLCAALALLPLILSQRSQRAHARYLEELLAKGEELEVGELLPEHAPGDATNAALLVERLALLPRVFASDFFPEIRKHIGPGKAAVIHRCVELRQASQTNSWESLEKQLNDVAPALNAVAAVLRQHTAFDFKFDYGPRHNQAPRSHLTNYSAAATWFAAAAVSRLRHGERTAALRQIANIRLLADTLKAEREPINQLVRIARARLGLAATWEALQAPDWTDAELAELQALWEPSGYAVEMLRALEMERVMYLASLRSLRNADPGISKDFFGHEASGTDDARNEFMAKAEDYMASNLVAPFWSLALGEQAEHHFLWHSQHLIDGIRLAVSQHSALVLQDTPGEYKRWRESAWNLDLVRFMFTVFWVGFQDPTERQARAMRAETEREMTLAEIALRRYTLRHGHGASRLEDLVPEFLPKLPLDFMNGQPLCYRPNGAGWVLYSVGNDGKDDGGNANSREKQATLGLWSGRDAVWPVPASAEEADRFDADETKKLQSTAPPPPPKMSESPATNQP